MARRGDGGLAAESTRSSPSGDAGYDVVVAPTLAVCVWCVAAFPWLLRFCDVEPYMDEIFHVAQAQRYCSGRFTEWDPKITTFPGLYLVATVLATPAGCSVAALRAVNALFGVACLLVLFLLLRRRMSIRKAALHALVLALYPINFFFTFLFYTDVGSLFFVLLTHLLATPGRRSAVPSRVFVGAAAVAGGAAVAFRQTNAVWVMFTFGTAALADLEASDKWNSGLRGQVLSVSMLVNFMTALLSESTRLLGRLGVLLLPPFLFVVFVFVNGSVVVGDHSNHRAVLHWAQLAYLVAVTAALWGIVGSEAAVSLATVRSFTKTCSQNAKALFITLVLLFGLVYMLHFYSLDHPFLLADNRHYTFYVWNRFLGKIVGLKEALAPLYLFCGWVCYVRLSRTQSPLWFVIWCIASTLTLVPAHLLEPRYWTTAVILAHAHGPEQSWVALSVSGAGCLVVNAFTLIVFCYKSFTWPNGEIARFMW
eukprot:TRINITY_DN23582_c0_g1_i1.p1 TRINITY_DN23582_c0_g1~~TRINITY_DN23582_c0_g1_i1.p1  ORF type:complete len:480 (-),score=52.98 TRINITY_DN23582_c0_g1_i1:205-1644(-)